MMLTHEIGDERAWTRSGLRPADWLVRLPDAAIAELEEAARRLRQDPLPVVLLGPDEFPMPACAETMASASRMLRHGTGLVVVDRLPLDRLSVEDALAAYWVLASMLGRPVAQKWDGALTYDVRDTGKSLEYGVRRSVTNLELLFHTDGPWLDAPPELVGLLCVHPAQEGGVSRFVSLVKVHNELRRRHPDLLPRLYRPFPWDRQGEHAPGDTKIGWQPVFAYDGRGLIGRCNDALIRTGAELSGTPLDSEGQDALAGLRDLLDDPQFCVEFTIERGQIQYLHNLHFAHSRTQFRDAQDPARKRHLIRLWNRNEGRRTFHG